MTKPPHKQHTLYRINELLTDGWEQAVALAALRHVLGVNASFAHAQALPTLRRVTRLLSGGYAIEAGVEGKIVELSLPRITSRKHIQPVLAVLQEVAATSESATSFIKAAMHLQSFSPPPGYLSKHATSIGAAALLDTGQPNSSSLVAGLQALGVAGSRRNIAVIGTHEGSTGDSSSVIREASLHTHVALVVGDSYKPILPKLSAEADAHYFARDTEAAQWLIRRIKKYDTLLVSGSNVGTLVSELLGRHV